MNRKQTAQKEPLITEEDKQNDPVIRTIFKKVRNMTKKISDIEQLEGRADLKPEQVDKVKSKNSLVDDRKKYEEFAKFYKTIINENAAQAKGLVNPEYVKIAQLLVLSHFLTVNPDSNAINTLNEAELKIVTGFLKDVKPTETIAERTERLSQTIRNYMENNALVNKVGQLMTDKTFSANTHQKTYASLQPVEPTKKEVAQTPAPEPVVQTPQPEPVKEVPVEAPKVVAPAPKVQEKAPVVETSTPQPVAPPQPTVKEAKQEKQNADAPKPVEVKAVAPATTTEKVEQNAEKETHKTENDGQDKKPFRKAENRGEYNPDKKRTYRPKEGNGNYESRGEGRGDREYKPRGNYRGDGEYRGNRGPRRQNDREREDDRSDTSLESSGEKRREFNKDERRELEDDGFMIVGGTNKPAKYKPRPKDTNETRAYHKKQHGYREKRQ